MNMNRMVEYFQTYIITIPVQEPHHCDKVFYTGSILYPHQTEVFKKYNWKCCD